MNDKDDLSSPLLVKDFFTMKTLIVAFLQSLLS